MKSSHAPATWMVAVAMLTMAPWARAQMNFAWDECITANSPVNKSYACDSNSGLNALLVASFIAPDSLRAYVGCQLDIDLVSIEPTVPNWWSVGPGQCRDRGLIVLDIANFASSTCVNPYAGAVTASGLGITVGGVPWFSPNIARIRTAYALTAPVAIAKERAAGYRRASTSRNRSQARVFWTRNQFAAISVSAMRASSRRETRIARRCSIASTPKARATCRTSARGSRMKRAWVSCAIGFVNWRRTPTGAARTSQS